MNHPVASKHQPSNISLPTQRGLGPTKDRLRAAKTQTLTQRKTLL